MSDRVAVMRAGRIVQIDTPAAIYHRPATRFIASFLGTANLFSGTAAEGAAMLTGPDGSTRITLPAPPRQHAVLLSVRPERMQLGDAAAGLANAFPATVRSLAFRGAYAAHELAVPALGTAAVYAYGQPAGGAALAPGAATTLGWHAEDGVLVAADA